MTTSLEQRTPHLGLPAGLTVGLLAGLVGTVGAFFVPVVGVSSAMTFLIPVTIVAGIVLVTQPTWRRFGGGLLLGSTVLTAAAAALIALAWLVVVSEII